MENKRVHLSISGRVQGVCFRMYTRDEAYALGVRGWVMNLPDGRVETEFEGPAEKVDRLVRWCRQGPAYAQVTDVEVRELPYRGDLEGFGIRR